MPAEMQVKLLRVLEERAVQRVGGRGQIGVDVRIIAATHRDIDAAIERAPSARTCSTASPSSRSTFPALPSGRRRAVAGRPFPRQQPGRRRRVAFSAEAYARMAEHGWPGNVRELRNFVDRAVMMFAGRDDRRRRGGRAAGPPWPGERDRDPRALGATDRRRSQPRRAAADEVVVPIRGRSPSAPPPQMNAASRSRSRKCWPRSSAAISSRR